MEPSLYKEPTEALNKGKNGKNFGGPKNPLKLKPEAAVRMYTILPSRKGRKFLKKISKKKEVSNGSRNIRRWGRN